MGRAIDFDAESPIKEELPVTAMAAAAPEREEEYEACRLREAARVVIFDHVHGRKPMNDFARRLRGALNYMRVWHKQPYQFVLARA